MCGLRGGFSRSSDFLVCVAPIFQDTNWVPKSLCWVENISCLLALTTFCEFPVRCFRGTQSVVGHTAVYKY